jgi:hypothetical protein
VAPTELRGSYNMLYTKETCSHLWPKQTGKTYQANLDVCTYISFFNIAMLALLD